MRRGGVQPTIIPRKKIATALIARAPSVGSNFPHPTRNYSWMKRFRLIHKFQLSPHYNAEALLTYHWGSICRTRKKKLDFSPLGSRPIPSAQAQPGGRASAVLVDRLSTADTVERPVRAIQGAASPCPCTALSMSSTTATAASRLLGGRFADFARTHVAFDVALTKLYGDSSSAHRASCGGKIGCGARDAESEPKYTSAHRREKRAKLSTSNAYVCRE